MKRTLKFVAVLVGALMVFQGPAYADMLSGTVASIDPAASFLEVSAANAETGAEEITKVSVKPETAFNGVASLADLQVGSEVDVDWSTDELTGQAVANSITVAAEEAPAEPVAAE